MMAYFECSQTFKMFYFHRWGGIRGASKGNTWWPFSMAWAGSTFQSLHVCSDFIALQTETERKRWVPSLFWSHCWEMVSQSEICLSWDDPGLNHFCHRNHHYYKHSSLEPEGTGSYNKHQVSAQVHLLSWSFVVSDIAGDQPSAQTLGVHF